MAAAEDLRDEIYGGTYDRPDAVFPSETQLAARYGMARMTIRRALVVLQDAGLITTRWGKGSVVVPPTERPARGDE
ncbi:GntR family transcriptional regulator [Kitasatospora griseola]